MEKLLEWTQYDNLLIFGVYCIKIIFDFNNNVFN